MFRKLFVLFLFVYMGNMINAQVPVDWIVEENKARTLYNQGKIDEAIILFREIILSSNSQSVKRESYYWISMAYINSGKYKQAEVNLEYYLANYTKDDAKNYLDAFYQKGRLLFLQEKYEGAIAQLLAYIEKYPEDKMISNAYYWIGESLFALGDYDKSEYYFNIITQKYAKSNKAEASYYKIKLIQHKKTELTLQNLLKWSQEQYLATLNKLRLKEKMLEDAISKYGKGSGNADGASNIGSDEIERLKGEMSRLKSLNSEYEDRIKYLEGQINIQLASKTSDKSEGDLSDKLNQLQLRSIMLDKKEKALRILEEKLREKEASLEKSN